MIDNQLSRNVLLFSCHPIGQLCLNGHGDSSRTVTVAPGQFTDRKCIILSNICLNCDRSNGSYWTQQSNDLLTSWWDKQTQTINDESNLPPKRFTSSKQAPPAEQSAKVTKSLLSRATASEPHCALDGLLGPLLLWSQYIALKG